MCVYRKHSIPNNLSLSQQHLAQWDNISSVWLSTRWLNIRCGKFKTHISGKLRIREFWIERTINGK